MTLPTFAEVIAKFPGSDKDGPHGLHSYGPVYDELLSPLRELPVRLLEVGVRDGSSLRAWTEYFPNAELIVGVDNGSEAGLWQPPTDCDPRIKVVYGDSTKPETLYAIGRYFGGFDIGLDDGCHKLPVQIATFAALKPFMKAGGVWVTEDVEDLSLARQLQIYFGGDVHDLRERKHRHDDILWTLRL